MSLFVLVSGPPGSGKTTLAAPLAARLELPLISKDVIKEALMESLGAPATVEESRRLGRAATEVMRALAETTSGAVLENAFTVTGAPTWRSLPGTIVEVRCSCPRELALARYRGRTGDRHRGHLDALRDESEIWNDDLLTPLGVGSLIDVDTSAAVDLDALVEQIRAVGTEEPGSP